MHRRYDSHVPSVFCHRSASQQVPLGGQQRLQRPAVKPVLDWESAQVLAPLHHQLQGVGQLELAPGAPEINARTVPTCLCSQSTPGWASKDSLTVDADTMKKVRRTAVERDTTLTAMVRDYLISVAAGTEHDQTQRARDLERSFQTLSRPRGRHTWTRDELHARQGLPGHQRPGVCL